MPKRKITLAEAFDVIEQHGLQVQVSGVADGPVETLADFTEQPASRVVRGGPYGMPVKQATPAKAKMVKVTLYAAHTIGSGGENVGTAQHPHIVNSGVLTYGPGRVDVPAHMVEHLLYQDQLARAADDRTFDRNVRSYVIMQDGARSVGRHVSNDTTFDMSGLLGSLHESLLRRI